MLARPLAALVVLALTVVVKWIGLWDRLVNDAEEAPTW